MAPAKRPGEKVPHGFLARTIYKNTLPDIPFEPKFLEYKFDDDRFTSYNTTSLERQHRIELHVPRNLGIHIELIDPRAYQPTDRLKTSLHPADEALLEDEKSAIEIQRSQIHNQPTNIFRRSEITASKNKHFGKEGMEIMERIVGAGEDSRRHTAKGHVKQMLQEQEKQLQYKTKEQQIETIEKGFQAVKETQKYYNHHTKKGVHAVEYMPVFPDFETWMHPCCQVVFDNDPAKGIKEADRLANDEELSQAMIRGMVDEDGDQFVAYFMPTPPTLEKRNIDVQACVAYDENETYEYKLAKEYNWIVKNNKTVGKNQQNYEQNYFFAWRDGQVFYNELDTKVRLTKRKKEMEQQKGNKTVRKLVNTTKAILSVKHRPLNEQELGQQGGRNQQLTNEDEEDSDSEDDSSSSSDDETADAVSQDAPTAEVEADAESQAVTATEDPEVVDTTEPTAEGSEVGEKKVKKEGTETDQVAASGVGSSSEDSSDSSDDEPTVVDANVEAQKPSGEIGR